MNNCVNTHKEEVLFKKNGYSIIACKNCAYRFTKVDDGKTHINKVYSDGYFFEGKTGYPNYLKGKDLLYKYGRSYAAIVSKFLKPGKILDAGCAAGFILKGFIESGWKGTGIEPNNTMASYGREELNLNIQTGSLETFESGERFDLITMIQVIGHFYEIDKVMQKLKTNLANNGMVLVESWDMGSRYARLMGKNWHEYSPPSVIRWFSDETLCRLFEKNGFTLVAKGFPPKKINVSHALSLLKEKSFYFPLKKELFSFLNWMFGKLNLNYPLRDLKWYLFQQNETLKK
ncbi:MAG: class I SAM-dependent methyltransferase [Ginsengibacter sp.]